MDLRTTNGIGRLSFTAVAERYHSCKEAVRTSSVERFRAVKRIGNAGVVHRKRDNLVKAIPLGEEVFPVGVLGRGIN
ncbi:hypothetical protein Y032_0067g99 [Ancylostoma ceylanicum]|uniref:Uncharacterized protein n=1 Tax=Ancylostoma ceylanicum TaxID=53326 RepID=A0A016TZN9_9BILA|nr:hypothetical protein Y032_0067g99 [Ancylostoma ceylanicum]